MSIRRRIPQSDDRALKLEALAGSLEPIERVSSLNTADALDRRRFLQSAAAASLMVSGGAATAQSATSLEGYAQSPSVHAGQTLAFSVRDPAAGAGTSTATYRIVRLAGWVDLTMQQGSVTLRNHAVPADAASNGCRWPAALSLPIPIGWPSGVYYAHFAVSGQSWCSVPFVVRPPVGAAAQRVLVVVPVSTAQAKNNYGGSSLYDYGSAGGRRLGRVSFARPLVQRGLFGFDPWQPTLARWLNRRSIRADFCTDVDLHDDPALLNNTALMLVAGHHAYWTRQARAAFDARVATGMNAALLAGQNMCWQSRLERDAAGQHTLVCFKDAAADPDTRAAYKTVRWAELNPPEPENSSTGLGSSGAPTWLRGDVPPTGSFFYTVTPHWVFEGTNLRPGIGFGEELIGPFTDHAAQPTSGEGTFMYSSAALNAPVGVTLLGTANVNDWERLGGSVFLPRANDQLTVNMSIFSRNGGAGTVFNAGTSNWVKGLEPELRGAAPSKAGRITTNVVQKLSAVEPHYEAAQVRMWQGLIDGTSSKYAYTVEPSPPGGMIINSGVSGQTTNFRAFVGPVPGAVPIYRFKARELTVDAFRYRLSLSPSVGNGWTPDGIAFYAYATALPKTVPVYQYHKVQTIDGGWRFIYWTEQPAGFGSLNGLAFFAPTNL